MTQEPDKRRLAQQSYEQGQQAFPKIDWNAAALEDWCLPRWSEVPAHELRCDLETANGFAEQYLVAACLAGRPGAVETLEKQYISKLEDRVRRLCGHLDAVDEVLQVLRHKLLLPPTPRLEQYRNRGRLEAWLTVVATRTALDIVRSQNRHAVRQTDLEEGLIGIATGPEGKYIREELSSEFRKALKGGISRLAPRERFALKMHVSAGWSIDQIAQIYSAHRSTAARWLTSARSNLATEVRAILQERLVATDEELDALLGAMQSRFDDRASQIFDTSQVSSQDSAPQEPRDLPRTQSQ